MIDLTNRDVLEVYREQDYGDIFNKYQDPATVYSYMVLEGKQIAGRMIQLACFRHVQDLKRVESRDENFDFSYDLNACRSILRFAEGCPDVSDGKPLPLMMWQKAILCMLQGWRNKNHEKRYSRALLSVARTNGKTYLINILMWYAYIFECDGFYNQDLAYISNIVSQAKKGWNYLALTGNHLLENKFFERSFFNPNDVAVQDEQVRSKKTKNKIMRMSNESGKFDAFHFIFAVYDEAGDQNNDGSNLGKITSGMVQTKNHQFIQISTAYENANVPFKKDQDRLKEVMEHDFDRDQDDYLCLVWEQDSLNEQDKPETWEKSNPILGLPDKHDTMLNALISERNNKIADGTIAEFQNRNLNIWLQTKLNSYLSLDDIENSVISQDGFNIKGRECYIGWDASLFSDDTAFSFVFPYGNNKFHILQHSFVPLRNAQMDIRIKEKRDGIRYTDAERHGFCEITKNRFGLIDNERIYEWLMKFIEDNDLKVKFFLFDKWHANSFTRRLEDNTELLIEPVIQGYKSLSEPTVFMRDQFVQGNITMFDDPILKYSLTNAVLQDSNNAVMIDKDTKTAKIDCVDALIDAFYEASWYYIDAQHYEDKDKSPFAGMSKDEIQDIYNNYNF